MKKIRRWLRNNIVFTFITISMLVIIFSVIYVNQIYLTNPQYRVMVAMQKLVEKGNSADGELKLSVNPKNKGESAEEQLLWLAAGGTSIEANVAYDGAEKILFFDGGILASDREILPLKFYKKIPKGEELIILKDKAIEISEDLILKNRSNEKIHITTGKLTLPVYAERYVFEMKTEDSSREQTIELVIDKNCVLRNIRVIFDYENVELIGELEIYNIYKKGEMKKPELEDFKSVDDLAADWLKALL